MAIRNLDTNSPPIDIAHILELAYRYILRGKCHISSRLHPLSRRLNSRCKSRLSTGSGSFQAGSAYDSGARFSPGDRIYLGQGYRAIFGSQLSDMGAGVWDYLLAALKGEIPILPMNASLADVARTPFGRRQMTTIWSAVGLRCRSRAISVCPKPEENRQRRL